MLFHISQDHYYVLGNFQNFLHEYQRFSIFIILDLLLYLNLFQYHNCHFINPFDDPNLIFVLNTNHQKIVHHFLSKICLNRVRNYF